MDIRNRFFTQRVVLLWTGSPGWSQHQVWESSISIWTMLLVVWCDSLGWCSAMSEVGVLVGPLQLNIFCDSVMYKYIWFNKESNSLNAVSNRSYPKNTLPLNIILTNFFFFRNSPTFFTICKHNNQCQGPLFTKLRYTVLAETHSTCL